MDGIWAQRLTPATQSLEEASLSPRRVPRAPGCFLVLKEPCPGVEQPRFLPVLPGDLQPLPPHSPSLSKTRAEHLDQVHNVGLPPSSMGPERSNHPWWTTQEAPQGP